MATTDYDFQSKRNQILERAFRILGALSLGETLSAEMYTQGVQAMNDMVKSWQAERIFLWTLKNLTQALTATNASYTLSLDPPIIAIDRAYLRINNSDDPLEVISWRDYWDIPDKTSAGNPVCLALDTQANPTLYVYPVPTGNLTMHYLGITKAKDWDVSNTAPDFPAKWTNALTYGVAAALADEYGLQLGEKEDLRNEALIHFKKAAASDYERRDYEFVEPAFRRRR